MTTRQQFEAFADMIRRSLERGDDADVVTRLAQSTADIFAADNPRFDRDKFLAACGVTA